MFLRELFTEATAPAKRLGRAFNHLEDLVFFYGSTGTREALDHLKEINKDSSSIRMKWDGSPQVYWGREKKGGPLILAGHNGWGRGVKTTSPHEIYNFIANQSGNPRTPEERESRERFAHQFSQLYPLFDAATPQNFVGFVYADALFLSPPSADAHGIYHLNPNPLSKTAYHIAADSALGKRIQQAKVMVVGHGMFDSFGAPDHDQVPKDNFDEFNSSPELIVLGPYYTQTQAKIDTTEIKSIEKYLAEHAASIDGFLAPLAGVAAFKDYIYKYMNTQAKQRQLANVGDNFMDWLAASTISQPQQEKIRNRAAEYPSALPVIFKLVRDIMALKDHIIDQLDENPGEILATDSEGWVRYAGDNKQHGNVKLVPRHRWTP